MVSSGLTEQLLKLELALMDPALRRTPATTLGHLLADDFVEFGKSGRVFNKAEILASITTSAAEREEVPQIEDFQVRLLASDCVLATYRINARPPGFSSLRSSIWVLNASGWQMCFHQGTVVPIR